MKTFNPYLSLVDTYLELLKNLSPGSKLKLIKQLSKSLKNPKQNQNNNLTSVYGSFRSKKTADELILEIKKARTFNRNTELL